MTHITCVLFAYCTLYCIIFFIPPISLQLQWLHGMRINATHRDSHLLTDITNWRFCQLEVIDKKCIFVRCYYRTKLIFYIATACHLKRAWRLLLWNHKQMHGVVIERLFDQNTIVMNWTCSVGAGNRKQPRCKLKHFNQSHKSHICTGASA